MQYDIEERDGKLVAYPDFAPTDINVDLQLVGGRTPMSLVVALSERQRLQKLMRHPRCLISPSARDLIDAALASSKKIARPLREPTDYERIAYIDEKKELKCIKSASTKTLQLTEGKVYPFQSRAIKYVEPFVKTKMHFCEESRSVSSRVHQMSLEGKDFALTTMDDRGWRVNFRDHPTIERDVDESRIWEYFEKPTIPTLAEDEKEQFDTAMEILQHMEIGRFKFYPGQMKYIAQAACADSALISAETGVGKTLIAICLVTLKMAGRVLIVAPKGTVKDSTGRYNEVTKPSQWTSEFRKFAPDVPVHTLFSRKDYQNLIKQHGGELPYGVFLTYDHVMFRNGMEQLPSTWYEKKKDTELLYRKHLQKRGQKLPPLYDGFNTRDTTNYHFGIGRTKTYEMCCTKNAVVKLEGKSFVTYGLGSPTGEKYSIKCVDSPCLATEIGHYFWDMVILDEAHLICNLESQITRNFIRMQPKYKFALSATPIPNMVWNIFSLMGWLCVPNWYQGHTLNPRWPYKLGEISDFKREFVTNERDHTLAEQLRKNGRGPSALKQSPVISQPTKLLKLLRPTVAFISKIQCNPDMPKSNIYEIRVPMTQQQRMDYVHYMDPGNIPCTDARFRYGMQMSYLRGISASPADAEYAHYSKSNFTPKVLMILEKIYHHVSKGEQVVHVSARHGMTNEIAERLRLAGVKYARIDGTNPDKAREAAKFKDGDVQVMLMGIKCAQAFSFEQCKNLIIGSLEWSYGVFNQALGRIYRLTSPEDVNVYVMLHRNSIEEMMFDRLGTKEDAATICLYGKRVPRDIKTVDDNELLAQHVTGYDPSASGVEDGEAFVEKQWDKLLDKFNTITHQLAEAA
jgi:SNF2 family DNA or RNA helicase